MTRETTEQLARELARRAEPVRRIPRLRVTFAQILAVASVATAVFLAWKGVNPTFLTAPARTWMFTVLVVSLVLMGGGGTVAALAMSVPGREAVARAGLVCAALGMLLAALGVPFLVFRVYGAGLSGSVGNDVRCLLSACAVGIPPAMAALWFVARAVPHRPGFAVLAACAGAVGLGAVAAQASCPMDGLRHVMLGHALAPLLGGLLLALPLLVVLGGRRRGRR